MIHVIATIAVEPDRRDEFLTHFNWVVPFVRAEEGCHEYTPTVDAITTFSAQPPVRHDTVTVLEKWESLDALKAHMGTRHMAEYRERVTGLVVGVTLHVTEPA
jgi:quinol monooxygenase YgiN